MNGIILLIIGLFVCVYLLMRRVSLIEDDVRCLKTPTPQPQQESEVEDG